MFISLTAQRLHATHNLMELLSAKHAGIPPTLRDDRLSEEVILFIELPYSSSNFRYIPIGIPIPDINNTAVLSFLIHCYTINVYRQSIYGNTT